MNKQSFYKQYDMEELLPIVADLTKKFTSNESSSITYERANQLMEAVIYCIRELDVETGVEMLKGRQLMAREAYERGYQVVVEKTLRVKEKFNGMITTFESYGNCAYYETVVNGLPAFFLYYDPKFMPQNHILTLDYPVLGSYVTKCGVDAIEQYVNGICLEQLFLNRLPKEYVMAVLEAYHPEYKELVINVSTVVMRNLLGCMLADKPVSDIGFSKEEYESIKEEAKRTEEKIEAQLAHLLSVFLKKGYLDEAEELHAYFRNDLKNFVYELKNAAKYDSLDALFVR